MPDYEEMILARHWIISRNVRKLATQILETDIDNIDLEEKTMTTTIFAGNRTITDTPYKGYNIVHNFYGDNEYTVQFCGDDIIFETFDEAAAFIDEMDADPENRREY